MRMDVPGGRFSVEIPAGWSAEWRDARTSETRLGALQIRNPENDFSLRITPWWLARPWYLEYAMEELTWEVIAPGLVPVGANNEAREPHPAWGDFQGSEWMRTRPYDLIRGWYLTADEVMLCVDYIAYAGVGQRDDAALRGMLDSMRLLPPQRAAPGGAAEQAAG